MPSTSKGKKKKNFDDEEKNDFSFISDIVAIPEREHISLQ